MNEQLRLNVELTQGVTSHTLDIRSIMPDPTPPTDQLQAREPVKNEGARQK